MADISDVKVQITLTIGELKSLVGMINHAAESFNNHGFDVPEVVDEVSGLYFELMENIKDGMLGDFAPE